MSKLPFPANLKASLPNPEQGQQAEAGPQTLAIFGPGIARSTLPLREQNSPPGTTSMNPWQSASMTGCGKLS
jgi:hypothetical protein